jgi:hypothetical protein
MMKPRLSTEQDILLFIAATLNVHEASQNPLECGGELSKQGIEQLEAFLWAIDQVKQTRKLDIIYSLLVSTVWTI